MKNMMGRLQFVKQKALAAALISVSMILIIVFTTSGGKANIDRGLSSLLIKPQAIEQEINIAGTLVPATKRAIVAPFDATISALYIEQGQSVRVGDLLVALDTSELDTLQRSAEIALLNAENKYEKLNRWGESKELIQARTALATEKQELEKTEKVVAETQALYDKGIVPRNELDREREQIRRKIVAVENARLNLSAVLGEASKDKLRVAFLELENARAAHQKLVGLRNNATIKATIDGVVQLSTESAAWKNATPFPIAGEKVVQGQTLFVLEQTDKLNIAANVSEMDVAKLRIGSVGQVMFPAESNTMLNAEITAIADQANRNQYDSSGAKVKLVAALRGIEQLKDTSLLRVGGTVYMYFSVPLGANVILIPPSSLSFTDDTVLVEVLTEDDSYRFQPIEIGRRIRGQIEVLAGLEAGDYIRLSAAQND